LEQITIMRSLADLASEAAPEALRGPFLHERIRQIAKTHGITVAQASARVADEVGWSPEQFRDRLEGRWRSTPVGWEKVGAIGTAPANS
jgi:hypothetical protein